MSTAARLYLEAALILSVLAALLGPWLALARPRSGSAAAGTWLWAIRAAFVLAVAAPGVFRLAPERVFVVSAALPWLKALPDGAAMQRIVSGSVIERSTGPRGLSIPNASTDAVLALWMAAVAVWIAWSALARRRLRRDVERLPVVHRRGRMTVAASDVAATPFSLVCGRRAWIIVPTDLIARPKRLGLAVAHEAAHVRRKDAAWDIAVEAVRAAFAWNPAVHWWRRLHAELQEAACDAAVLARHAGSVEAYADMLVWAAEQSTACRFVPRGALGVGPRALHRRIDMVMRAQAAGTTQARVAAVVAIVVVAAAAALVRAEEATRRVSMEQAQAMAHKRPAPRLVVRVDDVILTELNALVATADDRARLKAGLDRMAEEGAATQALLRREGLPVELQAVPLVESGYRNLPQAAPADAGTSAPRGAGLWQFVPETARRFGLEVGPERDDRMDVARETAAAAAYLDALHARFGDWSLALAAYNQGEGTVERAITSGGTRDAAALARSGHLNRYHATVMAAVLLMENPQLLD